MKLETYITEKKLTHEAFAKRVEVSQATITRYLNGERFPSSEMVWRISQATNGKVTLADWFPKSEAAE